MQKSYFFKNITLILLAGAFLSGQLHFHDHHDHDHSHAKESRHGWHSFIEAHTGCKSKSHLVPSKGNSEPYSHFCLLCFSKSRKKLGSSSFIFNEQIKTFEHKTNFIREPSLFIQKFLLFNISPRGPPSSSFFS